MIVISGIDHVVFRVVDAGRMVAFYTAVLGGTLEKVQADIGLWQIRLGSALIDLVPVDGQIGRMGGAAPGAEGRNVDHVCLAVAHWDEAAIRAHLARHGVDSGETEMRFGATGQGPSIYITDPEGNRLELKGPSNPPKGG